MYWSNTLPKMKCSQGGKSTVVICFIKYTISSYTGKDMSVLFIQGRCLQKPTFQSMLNFDSRERVTPTESPLPSSNLLCWKTSSLAGEKKNLCVCQKWQFLSFQKELMVTDDLSLKGEWIVVLQSQSSEMALHIFGTEESRELGRC